MIDQKEDKIVLITTLIQTEGTLTITIQDNAYGINNDIIDRIYKPYFTTKHQSQGTGLGLYVVHQIITKNLNRTIHVENKVFNYEGSNHKGACFTITLPVSSYINYK